MLLIASLAVATIIVSTVVAMIATVAMEHIARHRLVGVGGAFPSSAPPLAIVLGARVWPSGRVSLMLEDRLATALELYQLGLVKKLFLSGDDSQESHHEVTVMATWLRDHGVSADDMICDPHGCRTFLTMLHARECGIHSALIVTQRFHLPRALWLARCCGIDALGVPADRRHYPLGVVVRVELREMGARLLAIVEGLVVKLNSKYDIFKS